MTHHDTSHGPSPVKVHHNHSHIPSNMCVTANPGFGPAIVNAALTPDSDPHGPGRHYRNCGRTVPGQIVERARFREIDIIHRSILFGQLRLSCSTPITDSGIRLACFDSGTTPAHSEQHWAPPLAHQAGRLEYRTAQQKPLCRLHGSSTLRRGRCLACHAAHWFKSQQGVAYMHTLFQATQKVL